MEFNIQATYSKKQKKLACGSFYACMIQRIFDDIQKHATSVYLVWWNQMIKSDSKEFTVASSLSISYATQ